LRASRQPRSYELAEGASPREARSTLLEVKGVACHNRGERLNRRREANATKKKRTKKKSSRKQAGAPTVPYVWEPVYRTGVVRGEAASTENKHEGQQVPWVRIGINILGPTSRRVGPRVRLPHRRRGRPRHGLCAVGPPPRGGCPTGTRARGPTRGARVA
jgi:hypothetical protein